MQFILDREDCRYSKYSYLSVIMLAADIEIWSAFLWQCCRGFSMGIISLRSWALSSTAVLEYRPRMTVLEDPYGLNLLPHVPYPRKFNAPYSNTIFLNQTNTNVKWSTFQSEASGVFAQILTSTLTMHVWLVIFQYVQHGCHMTLSEKFMHAVCVIWSTLQVHKNEGHDCYSHAHLKWRYS